MKTRCPRTSLIRRTLWPQLPSVNVWGYTFTLSVHMCVHFIYMTPACGGHTDSSLFSLPPGGSQGSRSSGLCLYCEPSPRLMLDSLESSPSCALTPALCPSCFYPHPVPAPLLLSVASGDGVSQKSSSLLFPSARFFSCPEKSFLGLGKIQGHLGNLVERLSQKKVKRVKFYSRELCSSHS